MWSLNDFSGQDGQGCRAQAVTFTDPKKFSKSIMEIGLKWSINRPFELGISSSSVFKPASRLESILNKSVEKTLCKIITAML